MDRGFHPVDAVAGAGVMAWIVGMALVWGIEDPATQTAGSMLWAGGVLVAIAAAVHTYRRVVATID